MKKLFATMLAVTALAVLSCAQSPPTQVETLVSLSGSVSQVVTQRLGGWNDLGGVHNLNVSIRGFGGFNMTENIAPAMGGLLAFSLPPIKNGPAFDVGPGYLITQGNKPEWLAYVAVKLNFKNSNSALRLQPTYFTERKSFGASATYGFRF